MKAISFAALVVLLLGACCSPITMAETAVASALQSTAKDIFTAEQRAEIAQTEQKYEFQAEVNRMMDILINSLYTNRDIFIRELISNSADALDKIRFIGLTNKEALGEGEIADLDVKISFNKENRTITLTDKGVGMTKDELIKNLGVVARSGTSEFVAAAEGAKESGKNDALSLIGQFGVGFYSVYLVAEKVTVTSKSYKEEDQHIWESTANSVFTIAKDPRGNTLGRGTQITIHLKPDADEFLSEHKISELAHKYSQFINFPIYVEKTKTITEEVEVEKEDSENKDSDEVEVEDDDEPKPKTEKKTIQRVVKEHERINSVSAIWTRAPSEITNDEYTDFYKSLSKDTMSPSTKLHFTAEGDLTFKSILYIPAVAESGLYDHFYETNNTSIKLYVRRVLISESFKDFLPRYMNFVKGVVDSDDLPLNVNRETLAQSRVLKIISKKVSRKVLELLKKMAAEEKRLVDKEEREAKKAEGGDDDDEDEDEEDEDEDQDDNIITDFTGKKLYSQFWKFFGRSIKLGLLEDSGNKSQLAKLLRFKSLNSGEKLISLDDYIDKMPEDQKSIYYMTGESEETILASPFLESAKLHGYDVLIMPDPIDEYVVVQLPEYDGTSLVALTREGVTMGKELKNLIKQQTELFKPLVEFLRKVLGNRVVSVQTTQRLGLAPMIVATDVNGWSANMERIMKSQTLGDNTQAAYMSGKKSLEINPYHPAIKKLNELIQGGEENDTKATDVINMLFDTAMLQSGFPLTDTAEFASRVSRVVAASLNYDPDTVADAPPKEDISEDELQASKKEVKEEDDDDEDELKDEL